VSSEQQALLEPDNAYAATSREEDWRIWEQVRAVPWALAESVLLDTLGFASHPITVDGVGGIVSLPDSAPVVDLSVTSELFPPGGWESAEGYRAAVSAALVDGYGLGRYGEGRLNLDGLSTLSTGAEVFAPAGTVVSAPSPCIVARADDTSITLSAKEFDLTLSGVDPAVALGDEVAVGEQLGSVTPSRVSYLPDHVFVQVARTGLQPPRSVTPKSGWLLLTADPSPLVGRDVSTPVVDPAELLRRRNSVLAPAQEHYYENPPQIERGWRHHLYDTTGRRYLDMVNNVAILGHSHPGVEHAVSRQLRLLNTNSRFHYDSMVRFGEQLVARLPDSLDTVFFVSTGSEANEVALRLIRAATGARDVVAVRSAYHGWTTATDEISTSIADNPAALETRPEWIHTVESPNAYRGTFRGSDAGSRYVADVALTLRALAEDGRSLAGFIAEPVYGNAGGVLLPDGYLTQVYDLVRGAGGLCIADEVQVGYGRLGEFFWGFEQQGVIPDVVTMAKCTGNGVPVGAVVTTAAIAKALEREGSFFSSMGGTPVGTAAALAVLQALDEEQLQDNAKSVGAHINARLRELATRHALIGTVHGIGLYQGVELIRDPQTLEPASAEAFAICERMLDLGVIVQPTGDYLNVLKVKPPLCLDIAAADTFVDALDQVLSTGW
ncbi:MAG TPA: aminotransferase class III-fold pyridoxal phosphate-dependent enzyme, partial [Actinomycetes bacterium]|nr:aminotransferase class III-fold pyridoxal phosphate-dependent enzyme [Actinomycetes bacterium]